MKNNIFGYVFFIFIVGIMAFAIYKVNYKKHVSIEGTSDEASQAASVEKGTSFRYGISEFDTINPIITTNKKVQDITKIIYEPLVNITQDGKAEGCLAKEWETTDNITYIVKLKSGIKWTDGTYFSSDDVKYTIDRLKETENSVYAENVKNVKEVDIIDNTTLRIILSKEVSFFEYYLNFPILSSKYYGEDDFWRTNKNEAPITTGRFKIFEVTGSKIILAKNENWWNIENDNSIIDKITINFYSSTAELYKAFKMGNIDLISTTNENYQEYIGKIGYNTAEAEGREYLFLAFNTQSRFLSDKNIRKAIKCAINKEDIISNVYNNNYSMANFPLLSSNYLVDDENKNSFNIDELPKALNGSGWKLRYGQWQKTINYKYTRLEFNLVVKNNRYRVKVAEDIKNSLAKQGIILNVRIASNEEYRKYLENKNYDMLLCEATQSIAPDLATYFGEDNLENYHDSEVKEIMRYIDNITDDEKLKDNYKKLYDKYNDDVPFVGIARRKIHVFTNSYLYGEINSRWYNLFFGFKNWYTS